jgi:adenosylmethionine-8-amino-7-oxononanoate aminotransferase
MGLSAAVALGMINIIEKDKLLNNIKLMGGYLEEQLIAKFGDHPNVGDIRGRGLFFGLEYVKNKKTKECFKPELKIYDLIKSAAISRPLNMAIYGEGGCIEGIHGDHTMIAP